MKNVGIGVGKLSGFRQVLNYSQYLSLHTGGQKMKMIIS